MLLIKGKFKISVITIIIGIICQVIPSSPLSNVTTVKMFFFFNVNFTKSIDKLHVLCITFMPKTFLNDQRSIARESINSSKFKS